MASFKTLLQSLSFRVMPIALCCHLLLPAAGVAEEENWYQVEMIIFANQAGRWQQSELWRDEFNLIYPKNMTILRPFREFEFEEFDTDFDHLRKQDDPDVFGEHGDAPSDSESELAALLAQEMEEQASEAMDNGEFSDFPALNLSREDPTATAQVTPALERRPMDLSKDPFILLPTDELQLLDSARRIRNAYDLRLISHIAWRQPVAARDRVTSVLLQGGEQFGVDFELEGLVQLSESRFVHVDINMFMSRFQRSLLNTTPSWDSFGSSPGIDQGSRGNNDLGSLVGLGGNLLGSEPNAFERIFTVQSNASRRVRSGELHYIDHPLLGVLVLVTPYELPDPVFEMRDFRLDDIPAKKPIPDLPAPVDGTADTASE